MQPAQPSLTTIPDTLPDTLLLIDRDQVPSQLQARLDAILSSTWAPGELAHQPLHPAVLKRSRILVTANQDLSGAVLARLPNLRLLVTTGTAVDYVDLDHCRARGIVVCNTPRYTGPSVAEHAFALLLASIRHICALDAAVRAGTDDPSACLGTELAGKTAGIIGLGDIGRRIARLARGFDMRVLFCNRSPKSMAGARQVSLDELLAASDVVFLTLPLTSATRGLLSRRAFHLMRPTAVVVNVSADELIDADALRAALRQRTIGGAALDVIGSPAPYLDLPRLTITPTRGWYTAECVYRRAQTWIETIAAYLRGQVRNQVA